MALREPDRTTPIDITGWTWLAQVRDEPDSTAILVTLTVTVTSAPQGELTVTMNEADSDDQALYGTYWDLQRVLPYPLTYVRGRLFPKKDVSRTP